MISLDRVTVVIALSDPEDPDTREQVTFHRCNLETLKHAPGVFSRMLEIAGEALRNRLRRDACEPEQELPPAPVYELDQTFSEEWPVGVICPQQ